MDKDIHKYRIDGFKQQDRFFRLIQGIPEVNHSCIALYFFLMTVNNRLKWQEWFTLTLSEVCNGTRMSEKTFYKAVSILESYSFIDRRKGKKESAPLYRINNLLTVNFTGDGGNINSTSTVNFTGDVQESTVNFTGDGGTFNNIITIKNNSVSVKGTHTPDEIQNLKKWICENAPRLMEMQEPFTDDQILKIATENKERTKQVLLDMQNKPGLTEKYNSAYLTFEKYLKFQLEREKKNQEKNTVKAGFCIDAMFEKLNHI